MDAMTRSSRISYACAFGATSHLVYQIILHGQFPVDFTDISYTSTLKVVISMLIYGVVFLPVFASLALDTAFSYGVGSLHVWMFLVVDVFRISECSLS
ncbi:unnamed protein product, partial [Lymnaea stagnalis]